MSNLQNGVVAIPNESTPREDFFAFDIPLEVSADEAARLIDEIVPEGFYPWQMVVWSGAGVRTFCKRSKASKPGELAEARLKASEVTRKAKDAEDAQADIALAEILSGNPRLTVGLARDRLGRAGFRRGNDWVKEAMLRAKAVRRANL